MAFGTATIPAVDKIFGPGNAYVCEAKRQVFGTVGVDLLPGPSELMVIADESARLDFAAADLLAQAEHGSGRERIFLVATSPAIISGVASEIKRQVATLKRSESVQRVLDGGFLAVEVANLAQAAEVANQVAPEHLELLVRSGAADSPRREGDDRRGDHGRQLDTHGARGLHGGPEPCASDRRRWPLFQRPAGCRLPAAHERRPLRPAQPCAAPRRPWRRSPPWRGWTPTAVRSRSASREQAR